MPDGNSRYQKLPRPESLDKFERYMRSKRNVVTIERKSSQEFFITRKGSEELLVHTTNIYIVSEADVYDIVSSNKDINCIVTLSAWNSYTSKAKEAARGINVGLFTFDEFMGAIYYAGDALLDYVAPKDREQ